MPDDATTAISLHNSKSTSDISFILDEKEKRLQTKEELIQCKEKILDLHSQNEKLLKEISLERSQKNSLILNRFEGYQEKEKDLGKFNNELQKQIEYIKDENITLKLKLSDLEGEIQDER